MTIQAVGAILTACIRRTAGIKSGKAMVNLVYAAQDGVWLSFRRASTQLLSFEPRLGCCHAFFIRWAAVMMLVAPLQAHAGIIHVDSTASGSGDGSSWGAAYTDLQVALSVAVSGDEIWVATGVYKPTSGADTTATFQLINNVAIYGGFAGSELTRDERDFQLNTTVLSGDIDNNDNADDDGVVVKAADTTGDNSDHVVTGSNTDVSAILDGFTITAGVTEGVGGGIVNSGGSPTISNVTFSGNSAGIRGGGMSNFESSPTLSNITFSGNSANDGGAMSNLTSSSPTLTNVKFIGNSSIGLGGGMWNRWDSSPTLTNVTFSENSSGSWGGGMFNFESSPILNMVSFTTNTAVDSGGGMANWLSNPTLTNIEFKGNSAEVRGGGIFNTNGSNPILTNVIFSGNIVLSSDNAGFGGGGMYNDSSSPTLVNVIFGGNRSENGGGGMLNTSSSNPAVNNTIFWNNQTGNSLGTASASIVNEGSNPLISYSLVQDCKVDGSWNEACGTDVDNTNLTDTDPLFIAPPDPSIAPTVTGNLRLRAGSSAIDGGNDGFFGDIDNATDLDGNPRKIGMAIDLGAFENDAYELVLTVLGSGSVDISPQPDPITGGYALGITVELNAISSAGWSFANWSGDLDGGANPTALIVAGDVYATASFAKDPPIADAGLAQTAIVESLITLDGSGSFDEDPRRTLTYQWSQIDGTAVTLSDSRAEWPTFTAPAQPGHLSFELLVTNDLNILSAPDTVVITVADAAIDGLSANSDGPSVLGQPTTFSASITTGTNVIYDWDFGDGNLAIDAGSNPSHLYEEAGGFVATITARNATNQQSATASVDVINQQPVADAGDDQTVDADEIVALDGSGSFDPDGHIPLSYQWTQTTGQPVTLSDGTAANPTFTSPFDETPLAFELVVTDSFDLSSLVDTVTVKSTLPEVEVSASTASGNGSITPASQTVTWGEQASFTVIPDEGWSLVKVSGDTCNPVHTSGTDWQAENVTEGCAVTATFLVNFYNIGGSISGLEGNGLALVLDNTEILAISENGSFQFETELDHDTSYAIEIETFPSDPTQVCFIANSTGTVNAEDVNDVTVSCEAGFTIGGTVSGLKVPGLLLNLNGVSFLYFEKTAEFSFTHPIANGASWEITLSEPRQHQCSITPSSGTIDGTNVSNVAVTCETDIEFYDSFETLLETPISLD